MDSYKNRTIWNCLTGFIIHYTYSYGAYLFQQIGRSVTPNMFDFKLRAICYKWVPALKPKIDGSVKLSYM